jgi:hypothetical protein
MAIHPTRVLSITVLTTAASLTSVAPASANLIGGGLDPLGIGGQSATDNGEQPGTTYVHRVTKGHDIPTSVSDSPTNFGVVRDIVGFKVPKLIL